MTIRSQFLLVLLMVGLSWNMLSAHNSSLELSGSVGHTSAFIVNGGAFSAESWVGLTDDQLLSGGVFALQGGQIAEPVQPVSAVTMQTAAAGTFIEQPLRLILFLMLLTGVVTLGMLHHRGIDR